MRKPPASQPTIRWFRSDPAPNAYDVDPDIALLCAVYGDVDTGPDASFVQAYLDEDLDAAWEAYQRAEQVSR